MPKRRERTEKLLWRLVAPGVLLLGTAFGTSPLNADDPSQNLFDSLVVRPTESVAASGFYLGQRALSQMLLAGPMLPLSGSRRSNDFGFTPDLPDLSLRRYRIWIRGFGHWSNTETGGQSQNLEFYSYGISCGLDQQIGRNFLLGLAFGGNEISAKSDKTARKNDLESDISATHGSLYFRTSLNQFYFDLEAGLGYNKQSWPSRNSLQWNINGEAGTWWGHGFGRVEPFLGLRHVSLDLDPGTESKTTLLGGVRYSWKTTGTYSVITPRLYGGVLHELGDRDLMNAALFVDAPTVFSIPGCEIAGTRFFFGGGFTSAMGRSLDLYLRYTAEFASGHASHTAMFGMNWNF